MNSLVKKFAFVFSSILVVFLYIVMFNSTPSKEHVNTITHATNLVKLPGISLSSTYIENRILEYGDFSNDFYLGMRKNNYTGFVYAK
ncbi:hypothetical protein [Sulfurimonas sp.]